MKFLSIAVISLAIDGAFAFTCQTQFGLSTKRKTTASLAAYPPRKNSRGSSGKSGEPNDRDDFDPILDEAEGRKGDGRNWIEKSSPMGIGKLVEGVADVTTGDNTKETDGNYDLRVDGRSFQTGPLSTRMYDALMSVATKRFPAGAEIPSELEDVYKIYALDITAKEAVKAALDQNGLELAIDSLEGNGNEDEGIWGDIDLVQLIDPKTGEVEEGGEDYDSFDTAVQEGDWEPGQEFNFIVRNVPARLKEMDISDLLSRLDPDGELRSEAKDKGVTLPDEDVASLRDLGKECDRRTKLAPYEAENEKTVFKGNGSKGYNLIKASDLLLDSINLDGTENDATLMHVMDSLVSHSCIVIDLSDGGTNWGQAVKMQKMWDTAYTFFDDMKADNNVKESLPGMQVAEGAGSPHAVSGFASYGDDAMQFLETRIVRDSESRKLIPDVLEEDKVDSLIDAFDVMCEAGKNIVRVAVAAANMEYEGFMGESINVEETSDLPLISGLTFDDSDIAGIVDVDDEGSYTGSAKLSSEAAAKMAEELIDDGKINNGNKEQGNINMSPHRLCRYEGKSDAKQSDLKETFGAHTDCSFMTMVPVAEVSGLEIFDEGVEKWLRPELLARQHWENERRERGLDPDVKTESITIFDGDDEKKVEIDWNSRYVVAMPGELLQIASRNEVAAAVHRVVSVTDGDARISAPVLLRARSGMRMNSSKYFGSSETYGSLLKECDGMKLEDIHDALQPSNYRK